MNGNNNNDADDLRDWAEDYLDENDNNSLQTASTKTRKRQIKRVDNWKHSLELNTTSKADSYEDCKTLVHANELDFKYHGRRSNISKWYHDPKYFCYYVWNRWNWFLELVTNR